MQIDIRVVQELIGLIQALNRVATALARGFERLERKVNAMPTRAEFDALKAQLLQAIHEATDRVAADIQALREQLKAGNPITDADLADLQADISAVGAIDAPPAP